MSADACQVKDFTGRAFRVTLCLNIFIIVLFTLIGYSIGKFGSDARSLGEIS